MLNSEFAEGAALLPRPEESTVVIAPPASGQGFWAGAPSAALGDDGIYLAYRLRRPVGAGRGYAIAVAGRPMGCTSRRSPPSGAGTPRRSRWSGPRWCVTTRGGGGCT